MNTLELFQSYDGTWLIKTDSLADRLDEWHETIKSFKNILKKEGN